MAEQSSRNRVPPLPRALPQNRSTYVQRSEQQYKLQPHQPQLVSPVSWCPDGQSSVSRGPVQVLDQVV